MIEILEFTSDGDSPVVRLGCSCGTPRLAAVHCEGDQIIYCTHCGEITSRSRLRNEVTLANQSGEWRWENVVDREECPLVNVSIPVSVHLRGDLAEFASADLAGCVTKISTDRCLLRLQEAPAHLCEALEQRPGTRFDLTSEYPPLTELTVGRLEEVVRPHGGGGTFYYKIKLLPQAPRQAAELQDFYQTACGLRFDWQVLVLSDPEHASHLRRMLVDCLPMARTHVAQDRVEFSRQLHQGEYNLLIMPPDPELFDLVRHESGLARRNVPAILALLTKGTAGEIGTALRHGASDVLNTSCDMGEMRHALQRCLEQTDPQGNSRPLTPPRRRPQRDQTGPTAVSESDEETIQLLLMACETHDPHSSNHLKRIAAYCASIAKCLGWENERIAQLATASKLHDAGKIGVPDEILRKTGALTDDERKVMQQHTRFGYHILQAGSSTLLRLGATIALRHHERYDGKGYPDGLASEAIPVEAQIVSVADVFDALTTARAYKPAWPNEKAIAYLVENKGKMFSPAIVDAFLQGLPEIQRSQLAFLDDFRDIWTERRRHVRHPMPPVPISMEIAMPEQTFRPFRLVGHLTNVSEGGLKAKITNVSGDLFSVIVTTRRYGKIYCDDPEWAELNGLSCEVVWIDYYAIPDPNACIVGLNFHRERPNLLDTLRRVAELTADGAMHHAHQASGV